MLKFELKCTFYWICPLLFPLFIMLGSSWSLATTAFDLETDSDQPDNANEKTSHSLEQTCWRRLEVAWIGSLEIIRCLSNFGLCSGAFASEAGVNVPSAKTPETLSILVWTWRPYSAQTLDAERIASELTFESQEYFRLVRFEEWVRETIRISPSSVVGSLEAKYNWLSSNLYYYLRRHPEECEKYLDVKCVCLPSLSVLSKMLTLLRFWRKN